MRLQGIGIAVLCVVLSAAPVDAAIWGMIKFQNEGIKAQPQAVVKIVSTLNTKLLDVMVLNDFSHYSDGESVQVKFHGDPKPMLDPKAASERVRQAAVAAAETLAGTKLAEYQVRIELDEPSDKQFKAAKVEKEIESQHRERARPSPRLEIQVKENKFAELTILDVPLVRALDQIGRQMPLSYVLSVQVVGQPIYVRLQDATLEEALSAIADSGNLKIEKQGKYLKFMQADRK